MRVCMYAEHARAEKCTVLSVNTRSPCRVASEKELHSLRQRTLLVQESAQMILSSQLKWFSGLYFLFWLQEESLVPNADLFYVPRYSFCLTAVGSRECRRRQTHPCRAGPCRAEERTVAGVSRARGEGGRKRHVLSHVPPAEVTGRRPLDSL